MNIHELFAEVADGLTEIFALIDIAEEEITAARKRHPNADDVLWHCFSLLNPASLRYGKLRTEMVYRGHCRELLDRVAAGDDLQPGTAAEVCCLMVEASQVAPLASHLAGLYFRMWVKAGLPDVADIAETSQAHEALEASRIDDEEAEVRHRLADRNRNLHLDDITCGGRHHGELVNCRYAANDASVSVNGNNSDNPTNDHTQTADRRRDRPVSPAPH
ncbi:MAG: hypothetical protein ACRDXX_15450 [Stackebrandtia sp.]